MLHFVYLLKILLDARRACVDIWYLVDEPAVNDQAQYICAKQTWLSQQVHERAVVMVTHSL